jgi:hypothetical protein
MLQKALKYGAVLIGSYLVLAYSTGFGRDVNAVTSFVTKTTKTLQARA